MCSPRLFQHVLNRAFGRRVGVMRIGGPFISAPIAFMQDGEDARIGRAGTPNASATQEAVTFLPIPPVVKTSVAILQRIEQRRRSLSFPSPTTPLLGEKGLGG
jgi:hypothetical protein